MPAHYGAPAGRESSSRLSRAALLGGIAPGMAVSRIWFAATKLRPPPLPHSAVPRPKLLDRLQTLALASRLKLLSAAGGGSGGARSFVAANHILLTAIPGAIPPSRAALERREELSRPAGAP